MVYLAHPIDSVTCSASGTLARMVEQAVEIAARRGVALYLPGRAFQVEGVKPGPEVWKINREALHQCSGLLALWPGGADSVGVGVEIGVAIAATVPVCVVTDRRASWSLAGLDHTYPGSVSWYDSSLGTANAVDAAFKRFAWIAGSEEGE